MLSQSKFNLTRFKRGPQGVVEFATLIEQAEPAVRDKILAEVETQDPEFFHSVMQKVVFFEELIYLDTNVITEILKELSPKVLAYSLKGMPGTFRESLLGTLPFREMRLVLDEDERSPDTPESFIQGARKQILKHARTLEAKAKVILELGDCPRLTERKKKDKAKV